MIASAAAVGVACGGALDTRSESDATADGAHDDATVNGRDASIIFVGPDTSFDAFQNAPDTAGQDACCPAPPYGSPIPPGDDPPDGGDR